VKNQLKTVLLLGVLSALLIAIGASLGTKYLYGFTAFAFLLNFGSYFFSDRLVLAMHHAREVSYEQAPRLHQIVEEVAREAGVPKPRVFVIPEAQPNAFATGRNPAHGVVAVTEGIVGLLDERELRAVLGHEIGHVKNRDILVATVAAGIVAAVTYMAHVAQFAVFLGGRGRDSEGAGSGLRSLFLILLSPIAAALIQLGISRSREYLADETGARLTRDPEGLARALEKMSAVAKRVPAHVEPATASLFIVSPLTGRRGGFMGLFSTHPPMEERIRRLRAMATPSMEPRSGPAPDFDDPFSHHRPSTT
jgi:heat shock protein HtpX